MQSLVTQTSTFQHTKSHIQIGGANARDCSKTKCLLNAIHSALSNTFSELGSGHPGSARRRGKLSLSNVQNCLKFLMKYVICISGPISGPHRGPNHRSCAKKRKKNDYLQILSPRGPKWGPETFYWKENSMGLLPWYIFRAPFRAPWLWHPF